MSNPWMNDQYISTVQEPLDGLDGARQSQSFDAAAVHPPFQAGSQQLAPLQAGRGPLSYHYGTHQGGRPHQASSPINIPGRHPGDIPGLPEPHVAGPTWQPGRPNALTSNLGWHLYLNRHVIPNGGVFPADNVPTDRRLSLSHTSVATQRPGQGASMHLESNVTNQYEVLADIRGPTPEEAIQFYTSNVGQAQDTFQRQALPDGPGAVFPIDDVPADKDLEARGSKPSQRHNHSDFHDEATLRNERWANTPDKHPFVQSGTAYICQRYPCAMTKKLVYKKDKDRHNIEVHGDPRIASSRPRSNKKDERRRNQPASGPSRFH